ncbi:hypothetical protein PAXRUDRAFT_458135 [Paxillus rubicundulus Ve08.2h10]|uniref:U4/U6.U5 small nuclear ribonucleoprotein 27kDa protein domain-containing protein n=1 Tax=Paxillus rubicundulus Ve08.2h10 TaxID=930991 RepID=A0A0D0E1Q0_9AGAM|nr:hypothetical protein PAXRUDRAFT_458135 [Paxillus rubicundulus Ve08.2h10]
MSSRTDHRRRERSWEREDRDRDRDKDRDRYARGGGPGGHRDGGRRRNSRSRSPRRDRRDYDRDKDYKSSRRDDRRDHDRDNRRLDRKDDRKDERKNDKRDDRKDERREHDIPERGTPRDKDARGKEPPRPGGPQHPQDGRPYGLPVDRAQPPPQQNVSATSSKPNLDPDAASEEGEEMDLANGHDEVMMAAMGLVGFGSTKGKHVEGNQEGTINIKKSRTWRQYMNRRGGFNRPLDKIK